MVDEVARVSLALDPAVMLAGLKEATTPAGRPEALNATLWAAPAVTAVDMVATADEPRSAVNVAGLAAMEKLFTTGPDTTSDTEVVRVADTPVPVITTLYVPPAVVAPVERVSRALDPVVTLAGLKVAVTPAGRPEAPNTTLWAAPAVTDTETVAVTDELRATDRDAGLAVTEKSFVVVRETMQWPATLLNCFCTV
jgi:hypothetical protein